MDAASTASDLWLPPYTNETAPPGVFDRALRDKWPWIARFVNAGYPRARLKAFASDYAASMGYPTDAIPPYTTLRGWARRYRAFGVAGLFDKAPAAAGTSRALTSSDTDLVALAVFGGKMTSPAAVTSYLADRETSGASANYHNVRREIQRCRERDPHLFALATEGVSVMRNAYQLAIPQDLKPGGDTLLIDSTVADIWIRIPDANSAGAWKAVRPVLSIAEDEGSRLFVTFNLALTAITSGVILGMFRRAVMPEYNYTGLVSVGIPRAINVDKGGEHRAKFEKTIKSLHVEFTKRMPASPQGGARIERIIDTVQGEVFSSMRGYSKLQKPLDPYARGASDGKRSLRQLTYDPYRLELPVTSLPTYTELEEHILAWATVYNGRPHPGLSTADAAVVRVVQMAEAREAFAATLETAS